MYGKPRVIEVRKQRKRMLAGDMCVTDHPECGLLEFKRSMEELHANLIGDDRHRATRAFTKLIAASSYPVLVLDFPWNTACLKTKKLGDPVTVTEQVLGALAHLCATTKLNVIGMGTSRTEGPRRNLGRFCCHLLLERYLNP